MIIFWSNIISVIVGAVIGFGGHLLLESRKRLWYKKERDKKNKNILKGIEKEIEEGISRFENFVNLLKVSKLSPSHIYTDLWDSAKLELFQNLENIEVLINIHRIYYYFDLVNFNADRGDFREAADYANEYLGAVTSQFNELKKDINRKYRYNMENIKIKKRNPALVIIFSIITCGIYFLYWFVKTKEEIKSLGASIPSVWLMILPIGNMYLLYKYCDGFSEYVRKDKLGIVWFLAAITIFPVFPVIVQTELNKLTQQNPVL